MIKKILLTAFALLPSILFAAPTGEVPTFGLAPPLTLDDLTTPLDPTFIQDYPVYCNGGTTPVFRIPGTATTFTPAASLFPDATYDCVATLVLIGGVESDSAPFPRFVVQTPLPPVVKSLPPMNLSVTFN